MPALSSPLPLYGPPQPCSSTTAGRRAPSPAANQWPTSVTGAPSRWSRLGTSTRCCAWPIEHRSSATTSRALIERRASHALGHPALHRRQRGGQLARIGAAGHGQVRLAAALAADLLRDEIDELAGLELRNPVR